MGTTDATGATTTHTCNADGDRTGVTDPDSRTATTTYDALPRPLTVVRGAGSPAAAITSYAYDLAPGTVMAPTGSRTRCRSQVM